MPSVNARFISVVLFTPNFFPALTMFLKVIASFNGKKEVTSSSGSNAKAVTSLQLLSKAGMPCCIKTGNKVQVLLDGKEIDVKKLPNQIVQFNTVKGKTYTVKGI